MNNVESRNTKDQSISISDEVQKLFKKSGGKLDAKEFENLRVKYGNEKLVRQIQAAYMEKFTEINKRAKKFAILIREKYSNNEYPFHILLEKALKYKNKYNLSDSEFIEFQRIYESELVGVKSPYIYIPDTNIGQLLRHPHSFASKLSDGETKHFNEILREHSESTILHSQVLLQSIQYEDCSIEAITGKYDPNMHNPTNHVHAVIAALFLPKFDVVDKHFIHSNIGNIISLTSNNARITHPADIQLYQSLINDPNDIACDSKSVLSDLHYRFILQQNLWNCVIHLRNGQYYSNLQNNKFLSAVNTCRLNKYDTPDLYYGSYDGTIIKRLLSAFSFRPTVVAASPIYQIFSTNPYQQNIKPVVSYVPMINLKLPPSTHNNDETVELRDALSQEQYFIENGIVVLKNTSLIYSNEILIFFIDRRANIINVDEKGGILTLPYGISSLIESLNEREVNAPDIISIRDNEYKLRSVVVSEVADYNNNKKSIIGSSTIIVTNDPNSLQPEYLYYSPAKAAKINTSIPGIGPINAIEYTTLGGGDLNDFTSITRKRGIIFIYQIANKANKGVISW